MPDPTAKVFGVGLSRTGTTSLAAALERLGYRTIQYPHPERTLADDFSEIDRYDAATDAPVAECFPKLDARYPGSRFILTVRDADDWLRSVEARWRRVGDPGDFHASHRELRRRLLGSIDFDERRVRRAFLQHRRRVEAYFADRPGDLLVLDIPGGQGWRELAGFLGGPAPDGPFPALNATPRDGG
jgi:hypothetical protein